MELEKQIPPLPVATSPTSPQRPCALRTDPQCRDDLPRHQPRDLQLVVDVRPPLPLAEVDGGGEAAATAGVHGTNQVACSGHTGFRHSRSSSCTETGIYTS